MTGRRAFSNLDDVEADLAHALAEIRSIVGDLAAMAVVESFADVSLRVMRRTNPSKIRAAALTTEIKARLDGVPVV